MICPKCGSENVEINLFSENTGSTTVANSTSNYKGKGHGCFWWLFIGWWWWIVDLFIWVVAFIPRLAIQVSKKKQYTGNSVGSSNTINRTAYKSVCLCKDCAYNWVASDSTNANTTRAIEPTKPDEPFYKQTWFLVVCGFLFPPAGIAMVWLIYKDWDVKKKAIVTAIMAFWFIFVLLFGDDDTSNTVSNSDALDTITSASDVI